MAEIKNNAETVGKPEAEKEQLFTKAQVDELMDKERESWQAKLNEAEKVAQMDAQQKNDYRRKQAETALAEREAAVSKRELMADAAERLTEYKLPKSLISCVNFSSADECERSIEGLRAAFSEAVSVVVNERIRGSVPKAMTANGSDAFLDGLFK